MLSELGITFNREISVQTIILSIVSILWAWKTYQNKPKIKCNFCIKKDNYIERLYSYTNRDLINDIPILEIIIQNRGKYLFQIDTLIIQNGVRYLSQIDTRIITNKSAEIIIHLTTTNDMYGSLIDTKTQLPSNVVIRIYYELKPLIIDNEMQFRKALKEKTALKITVRTALEKTASVSIPKAMRDYLTLALPPQPDSQGSLLPRR